MGWSVQERLVKSTCFDPVLCKTKRLMTTSRKIVAKRFPLLFDSPTFGRANDYEGGC
jgi:hypothetical protein